MRPPWYPLSKSCLLMGFSARKIDFLGILPQTTPPIVIFSIRNRVGIDRYAICAIRGQVLLKSLARGETLLPDWPSDETPLVNFDSASNGNLGSRQPELAQRT